MISQRDSSYNNNGATTKTNLRKSKPNDGQLPTSEAPIDKRFAQSFVVCCLAVPVTASWCCAIPKASPSLKVLGPLDLFPTKNSSCRAAYFTQKEICFIYIYNPKQLREKSTLFLMGKITLSLYMAHIFVFSHGVPGIVVNKYS